MNDRIVLPLSPAGKALAEKASERSLPELVHIVCVKNQKLIGEVLDVDGQWLLHGLGEEKPRSNFKRMARQVDGILKRQARVTAGPSLFAVVEDLGATESDHVVLWCPDCGPLSVDVALLKTKAANRRPDGKPQTVRVIR